MLGLNRVAVVRLIADARRRNEVRITISAPLAELAGIEQAVQDHVPDAAQLVGMDRQHPLVDRMVDDPALGIDEVAEHVPTAPARSSDAISSVVSSPYSAKVECGVISPTETIAVSRLAASSKISEMPGWPIRRPASPCWARKPAPPSGDIRRKAGRPRARRIPKDWWR